LLFIVLDKLNAENDREISDHVLRMHRYRSAGEYEGETTTRAIIGGDEDDTDEPEDDGSGNTPVFQKFNRILHGGSRRSDNMIISIPFIQKYLMYAKNRFKPRLSDEAREFIASKYTELRLENDMKTLPITARSLETMIRLSEAHAKCRLSHDVSEKDAKAALELMRYALYQEANPVPRPVPGAKGQSQNSTTTTTTTNEPDSDNDSNGPTDSKRNDHDDGDDDNDGGGGGGGLQRRPKRRRTGADGSQSSLDSGSQPTDDLIAEDEEESQSQSQSQSQPDVGADEERVGEFMQGLAPLLRRKNGVQVDDIAKALSKSFSRTEVNSMLAKMESENKVSVLEGMVYRV